MSPDDLDEEWDDEHACPECDHDPCQCPDVTAPCEECGGVFCEGALLKGETEPAGPCNQDGEVTDLEAGRESASAKRMAVTTKQTEWAEEASARLATATETVREALGYPEGPQGPWATTSGFVEVSGGYKRYTGTCLVCRKTFTQRRHATQVRAWRQMCSDECRAYRHREQKREYAAKRRKRLKEASE